MGFYCESQTIFMDIEQSGCEASSDEDFSETKLKISKHYKISVVFLSSVELIFPGQIIFNLQVNIFGTRTQPVQHVLTKQLCACVDTDVIIVVV